MTRKANTKRKSKKKCNRKSQCDCIIPGSCMIKKGKGFLGILGDAINDSLFPHKRIGSAFKHVFTSPFRY